MRYIEIPYYEEFYKEDGALDSVTKKVLDECVAVRETEEYKNIFEKENPLVSVLIPTYNRKDTLINYSLKSVLDQTYKNLEIIVVGDNCTDGTNEIMKTVIDDRVTFINLLNHPPLPTERIAKWLSAGTYATNLGKKYFTGDFATYLDDDDIFTPDRIEKLVKFAQENRLDAIHHPFINVAVLTLNHKNEGKMNNSDAWWIGNVTTSAVFITRWLSRIPGNPHCWKINEPGDWHIFKRNLEVDAKTMRFPEILTIKTYSAVAS